MAGDGSDVSWGDWGSGDDDATVRGDLDWLAGNGGRCWVGVGWVNGAASDDCKRWPG